MRRKFKAAVLSFRDRILEDIVVNSRIFDAAFYLKSYPYVERSGMSPAVHYLRYGASEQRQVSDSFDILSYQKSRPLTGDWKLNPVIYHQLCDPEIRPTHLPTKLVRILVRSRILLGRYGILGPFRLQWKIDPSTSDEIELIRKSPLFDAELYLTRNEGLKDAGIDPAMHYHSLGWKAGLDPSDAFHTDFYLLAYPDARASGINPLLYHIRSGSPEDRPLRFDALVKEAEMPAFEHADPVSVDASKLPVKLIAYYLPQFHPIPENDVWWGDGFTEWTHVRRSVPRFRGHLQPRPPLDDNYYDLREPAAMERQIRLARESGLHGFCFYSYWFNGKRLLETPLDMFLGHKEWPMNFCICWANVNWTRRWDGNDQDILIGQEHSPEDDIAFLEDASRYLLDERYIRVGGKPLLIIYRPSLFPDMKATVRRWRDHFREKYGQELYIAMTQTFGYTDPLQFDMDAAIEFPPHNLNVKEIGKYLDAEGFEGRILEVLSLIHLKEDKPKPYPLYPGLMLNWDNTPRKGKNGLVFLGNTPERFGTWLDGSISRTIAAGNPDNLVFINAWNEWGEGTCLEPDHHNGYAYLNAVRRVLRKYEVGTDDGRTVEVRINENTP
jgi:hypothetical protein